MKKSRLFNLAVAGTLTAVVAGTLLAAPAAYAQIPEKNIEQASLGDSLTRAAAVGGKSSSGSPINNPSANWSTGTDPRVDSHLRQLSALRGETVKGYNYSVGGTTSPDIVNQAAKVSSTVDYTTILSGGNDICRVDSLSKLPSKAGYKANIRKGVDALLAKNPEMVIALNSIPNLKTLYTVGKTSSTSNLYHSSNRICRIGLGSYPDETAAQAEARRVTVDNRVKDFNQALSELADEYATVYYDNGAVYNTPFDLSDLSTADYFHPSYSGQQKVAQRTWAAFSAQGVYNLSSNPTTPSPTPSPETPKVSPTVTFVSSQTVSGSTQLAVTATSDSKIQSVSAYIPALKRTLSMSLGSDGKYRTAAINSASYPNGTYAVEVTAVDAEKDSTTITQKVTIKN